MLSTQSSYGRPWGHVFETVFVITVVQRNRKTKTIKGGKVDRRFPGTNLSYGTTVRPFFHANTILRSKRLHQIDCEGLVFERI